MRLTSVPVYFAVFISACGGMEDDPGDPSTGLAENPESIHLRDDVPAEDGLNPIATLSLDNGNALEFYEPAPGWVLISEVGSASNPLVSVTHDLESMSLVEIHRTFAPGHTVPVALAAAQRRLGSHVAVENVNGAETDVGRFANQDDVATNNDANHHDGTMDDDKISNPESGSCSLTSFVNEWCNRAGLNWRRCLEDRSSQREIRNFMNTKAWGALCSVSGGPIEWNFRVLHNDTGRTSQIAKLRVNPGQLRHRLVLKRPGGGTFVAISTALFDRRPARYRMFLGGD